MKVHHSIKKDDCLTDLKTSKDGLTTAEATKRLEKYGKNELVEAKRKSLFRRFFDQLKDMMIIVLIVAALISAVLAIIEKKYIDLVDSGIILLIVILNAIIGLVQEQKANNALEALKNINKPFVKVLRDGEICKIKSEELVIGDVVVLEAGDVVPADLRLIDSASLKIEEATLTGESVPSEKDHTCVLKDDTPLGDRKNMAYSSSIVSYGRGTGVVVATGMNTEVGKIANMLKEEKSTQTPLQGQLAKTAKILSILVLGIALIIFIASFFNETTGTLANKISKSFMTAVAIAVAAIPEGLPAVVTIVLAIGVKRMSEKNAIVKNLPAVETLGCCEVICSDKTGTITLNKMTVKQLYTPSNGLYYREDIDHNDYSARELVSGLALCNDTIVNHDDLLVGDPTETALTAYAKQIGVSIKDLRENRPRINEIPFDSKRKLMTTVHQMVNGTLRSYTKGAFDVLLNKCNRILDNNNIREITDADKAIIKQANKNMASDALRVLALAFKENSPENEYEKDLIFIGLVGMIDPPRKEVISAVQTCKKAGMKAIMITGDHIDTAVAIAKQIGIYSEGDLCITGAELDKLSQKEFMKNLRKYKVYARVSPENKVRIVEAYKSINVIVAMTGDGVNDAPSIKTADIGIGMGITGTDVSKGAADMILTDDNFATIIVAVEEGRKVYSNIQKAVQYLLSANIAEVLCLFIATIFLRVEFLTAIMILWINLVTDSFPALSLGVEKAEKGIMNEPPRKTGSSLFAGKTGKNIIIQGIFQTALTMASFCIGSYVLSDGVANHEVAMTMAFITLCLIQLFHAYNTRSSQSIFKSNPFGNKFINFSFLGGLALTLLVVLVPFLQTFFNTTSLTIIEWAISVGCAFLIIPLVELQKLFSNLIDKRKKKINEDKIEKE